MNRRNIKPGAEYDKLVKRDGMWYAEIYNKDHKIIDISPPKLSRFNVSNWLYKNYPETRAVR